MYKLVKVQRLSIGLDEAWDFFSTPTNLSEITPDYLDFRMLSSDGEKIYPGMIIRYRIKPLLGISVEWVTEISQVEVNKYFIDSQLAGPYSVWHHQHHFREIEEGVEMTDIIHFRLPLGVVGNVLAGRFVKKKVHEIFEYREKFLKDKFSSSMKI